MKVQISLTLKLVAGVVLILAIALAVLERKASGLLLGDKIQTLKDQTSQISYSLAVSASEKIKRLDRHLRLILTHSALNTPQEVRPRGEDMLFVGTLIRAAGKSWEVNWIIKPGDNGNLEKFGQEFTIGIQKNVQLDKVRGDGHHFARVLTIDGQPMFAMLIRMSKPSDVTERVAVGVLSASAFFDLVAPFKGTLTTAFLVDQSGVTYAHPSLSLTGAILKGNPIVDRIIQKFSASQQDQFRDGDETLIASFDNVPRTNLVAVTSISLTKSASILKDLKWSFAVLGVGLFFLSIILAWYISNLLKSPISKLRRVVDDLALGKRTYMEPQSAESEISELATSLNELDKKLRIKEVQAQADTHEKIYQEKMSAFARLSTGLVNELRNPLIGILGHTQLAREKIRDPESMRRHLDLIEKDVRKTKELIEDISQISGPERLELGSVNVYEALAAAIEQAGRKVLPQNISILKNLESVSSVTANAVLLRKALMNIISSSAALVRLEGSREIIVRLENDSNSAKITVIFESSLISGEDMPRIFDPFMITDGQIELGLDLALAKGICDAHDYQIRLERTGETHFQFIVVLPKVRELPAIEVPVILAEESPFLEDPGLEMKGLNFALPEFSMTEPVPTPQLAEAATEMDFPAILPDSVSPSEAVPKVLAKQIMSRVPLENMKIRIRKPTLRV